MAIKKIISLDVSSKSTGWSFFIAGKLKSCGVIDTSSKTDLPVRLNEFRRKLSNLLADKRPAYVVIENNFAKTNIKVLKILSQFAGVASECCVAIIGVTPYIMSNTTPKSYLKVKNKEQMFDAIVEFFEFDDWKYKKHNDMTDSIAQGLCYYDKVLGNTIREEKPYGYIYNIKE